MTRMIRALRGCMLLAVAGYSLWAMPARAAICNSSFVDVPNTANYCLAAQWLKARSITLGCTDTAHYCPDDAVSRAQMALFLNRMGNALAPDFEHAEQTFTVTAGATNVLCQTNPVDMGGFNHVATGDASGYFSGIGSGEAQFRLVYSDDGGTTWANWAGFYMPVTVTTNRAVASSTSNAAYFAGSQTVVFGLQVANTSNQVISGGCEVRARIENFNGVLLF